MGKRSWSLALIAALIAGAVSSVPASAAGEPGATGGVVPAAPNVVDDAGDANGHKPLTGQNTGLTFTGMDVLAGWLTHDSANLYMHIQTTTDARAEATTFQTNVGTAPDLDCVQLRLTTAGETNDSFSAINVAGDCGAVPTTQFGPLLEEEGPDGTAILTGTFPREGLDVLGDGKVLTGPDILVGFWGHGNPAAGGSRIGTIENTAVGTDYTISSGGGGTVAPEPKPKPEPPGKNDPPGKGKKKGCGKGKGKKKGACPAPTPPPAPSCAAYVPGEQGAAAETTVVTDAATEEAPLEVTITAPPGVPEVALGHVFHNLQVDAAAADAGLYVRYEFPVYEDHDIYLNYSDGSEAAHAGGFNPAPVPVALGCCDGTGTGGHSEQGAEVLDGVRTADCGGYTLDMASFMSEGGDMTLKLWLGEPQNDPAAPGGGESAMEMFYRVMGI